MGRLNRKHQTLCGQELRVPQVADELRSAEVDACHVAIAGHIAEGEATTAEEAMRSHLLDRREPYVQPGAWKAD